MGGLLDHKYKGMTAEKVYSILVKVEEALEDAINQINQQKPNGENSDEEQDAQSQGQGGDEESDEEGTSDSQSEADEISDTSQGNISEAGTGTDWDELPSAIGEVWDATSEDGTP